MDEGARRRFSIFSPYATSRAERITRDNGRFVYYTTADTAVSIISTAQVWMRRTAVMNDYLEVEHGITEVCAAYASAAGKQFKSEVDKIFPNLMTEIENNFNSWSPTLRDQTFITCVSEHDSSEDRTGRLSMWRAYGGTCGVAIVFKSDAFFRETNELGAWSSPVAYFRRTEVELEFNCISTAVAVNADFLRQQGRDAVRQSIFNMFMFAALCTKHPGFLEEREWRIVACPRIFGLGLLREDVHSVRGVPQRVLKLPLKDEPTLGVTGLSIPTLLDRVIIGPCEHPQVIREALCIQLRAAGVADPEAVVLASDIPLRHG